MISPAYRGVEVEREIGQEIEDGRRVGSDAHLEIRKRKGLSSRQTADIGEAVSHPGVDAGHTLNVPYSVFETHQVGAPLTQAIKRYFVEDSIVAVVHDDAEFGRGAYRLNVRH